VKQNNGGMVHQNQQHLQQGNGSGKNGNQVSEIN